MLAETPVETPADQAKLRRCPQLDWAFSRLLKAHYKTRKPPLRHAAELAVSTAHPNDTEKRLAGTLVLFRHLQVG